MSQTVEMVVDSTPAIRNLDKITNSLKATANQYNQTQAIVEKANRKVAESSAAFQKATSAGLRYDASVKRWRTSTGQFATAAEKAAAGVNDLNKQLQVNNRLMSSSGKATADAVNRMRSLVLQVGAAYSAYKILGKAVDAVNIGIQANQSWESQKLGIASVIGATNQLADAQGRVLQGSEKFAASQQVAEKLMERIQVLGLETVATTQDLVEGVQGIIAPATRVGIALEKVPDLAVNAAQAMGAMQIPLQQMRTEVEALLSGNINKAQDILATNLGITGEMVRNWQKQGVLLDEINKRLESFKLSGDALANTWGGLTSNLKEYVEFISRGATEGLFNSLKSSAREFQSLLISINEQTGRPEVSNKVNNLVAAYERLNDVIGDKILSATQKFSEWIEIINKPENLSDLEETISNIWKTLEDTVDVLSPVGLLLGDIFKKTIDGWNKLPDIIREFGLIGAIAGGKKGFVALGLVTNLSDSMDKLNKQFSSLNLPSLQHLEESYNNLVYIVENFKDIFTGNIDLRTKEWVGPIEEGFDEVKNKAIETTESISSNIRKQLEAQRTEITTQLETQKIAYEGFQRIVDSDLVNDSVQEAASQKAEEAAEQVRVLQGELDSITSTLKNIYTEADSIDWYELMNPDPINDTAVAFAGLLTTSSLFGKSVMTAKDNVDALDGSSAVASIDFRINTNAGSLFSDAGQGTMFALPQWSETWKTVLQDIRSDIKATGNTAGKTADKAKSKIESALHSVESELNKLQMTDAQYKQWQINDKIEKLEKVLGKANPEVRKLRAGLNEELQKNILEDIVGYADPAQKRIDDLNKEFDDLLDNLKASTKLSPEKKLELQTKAARQLAHALDEVDTVQKRILDFQKETSRIEAENSNDQLSLWQTRVEQYEKELWYVKDVAERRNLIERRVNAELAAQNKQYTADFAAMWEETYNRVDEAGADMLENFLNGSKNTFDSLKKMFIRTLAEMANAAWLRPITVQVMGTLGGIFGVGGTALAYDSVTGKMVNASGGGGMGNLSGVSNLSSFLPDSFTSGLSGIMGATLPGTVSALTTPGAYTAGEILLMQGGGTTAGTVGGQAALMSGGLSLGSALMYGGLGSLGYSLLGGALGLPQNKYSGITSGLGAGLGAWGASAALSGTALGATLGSAVPVVGTVIGAALGGLASSLLGGERKTHPSVYTKVEDASLFGSDWESLLTQGAWTDRASVSDAAEIFKGLGQVADTTANTILSFAQALPEEYAGEVINRLNAETVSFGRTITAGRGDIQDWGPSTWNFQFHDEEQLQEAINTAGEDIQRVMLNALSDAVGSVDMSAMFSSLDFSSTEGLEKAMNAINSVNAITDAIDAIREPQTQAEQQAAAFVEQMNALEESVKSYGLNAQYAEQLVGEYRTAYVDSYVEALEEMFNPLSQIEQQAKGYKEAIDGYVAALTTMGASEAQLAQVRGYTQTAIDNIISSLESSLSPLSEIEQTRQNANASIDQHIAALRQLGASESEITRVESMRAEAVRQATEELLRSFSQGLEQRYATLNGTSDAVSRAISQENELREAIQKFGEGSAQVAELLHVQAAENVYAAQASVDALQNQLNQLKAQAIQAEISALNEQMSAAKTLKDTWENLSKSLLDSRTKLWTSNTNALGLFARRDAAQSEFDRLYSLTMSGDKEAAAKLASSGDTLLSLLKETSANGEEYTAGFWNVEQKLKDAESVAGKQLSEAQKSYNALESQLKTQQSMLDALGLNNSSLDAINAQIVTVGQQLAEALGNLNIAQSNPNYGGATSGGGFVSWQDKLLQEKADALNAGQTLAPGQTAGGWTPEKVLDAIKENGWTVSEWYEKFGKPEGFASGGITPRNTPFLVGEKGPELMMSPQQYGVLNNQATRQLMMMPAVGTDGGATAIIAQLRENNAELKEQNRILYAMLLENQGTRKNTANTADSVENMVRTGVRARQQ